MTLETKEVVEFFESIEALEADKKAIADEIKDAFASYALNNEVDTKAVTDAYKNYKAYNKNKSKFVEIDWASDKILLAAVPELNNEVA